MEPALLVLLDIDEVLAFSVCGIELRWSSYCAMLLKSLQRMLRVNVLSSRAL